MKTGHPIKGVLYFEVVMNLIAKRKITFKISLKVAVIVLAMVGLFGFLLTRKQPKVSFFFHVLGATSALTYSFIQKNEDEWNPLTQAWKELESERERINNQYVEDCRHHETEIERLRIEHHEEQNQQKQYALEEQRKIIELYEDEMQLYIEQLELKENMLKLAKLPKMPQGISRTETYAGRIINFLYSKNIECDYADSWEEPTHDLIRLIPKNASLRQFKELADDLQLELRLAKSPSFDIVQGCIQIRIDTRLIDTDVEPKESKLTLVQDDWLPEIIKKIIHGKVDGESGAGKSVFVQNSANLLGEVYPDAEFIVIDPKYPLSLDWDSELHDWQRKPAYPGIENSLSGLTNLADTVKSRLQLVTEDVVSGKKPRQFSKKIFLIDEIDWITLEYGKEGIDLLQIGLKIGRALNVIVIYFGQTPRCSKLKMTKDDFRNSTNISLGSNIRDAIDTYIFDESYARELIQLYWKETNKGNTFICLVSQKGKKPFLAQLPAPGQYKPVSNSKAIQSKGYEFSEVTDSQILQLISEGRTDSEVVESLWSLKPSRSEEYKQAVARVKVLRLES